MTAIPYLLQLPDPDKAPARFLNSGADSYVVVAETAADALAFVQNLAGKKVWGNVTPAILEEAADMIGWGMRVQVVKPSDGSIVADVAVVNESGTGDVAATGSITFSSTSAANGDSVTVNGQAIGFVTAGAVGFQLDVTGVPATDATNVADMINANPQVFQVSAVPAAGLVTLTALVAGVAGNTITTVKSGVNIAVGGATLAGGSSGNDLNALAALAVIALNGTGVISHASYSAPTLTVASAADNLGDHKISVSIMPPTADNAINGTAPTAGVITSQGVAVPGFVGAITDGGVAGAALTAALAANTYGVPALVVKGRTQE